MYIARYEAYVCVCFFVYKTLCASFISGWNVWLWLVGVVSRRQVWLVGMGEIYGCGCKEEYKFPYTTYPYYSCICSFLQQHPYFLFIFKNVFRSLYYTVCGIYIYIHWYVLYSLWYLQTSQKGDSGISGGACELLIVWQLYMR